MKPERRSVAIVTLFDSQQPGFLDFAYRVRALGRDHNVTLISNITLNHAEFDLDGLKKVCLDYQVGPLGWLTYLWQVAKLLKHLKPDSIVLLHSTVAPIALLRAWLRRPMFVYWNEHPTHVAPPVAGTISPKQLVRFAMRWMMFKGATLADAVMPIGEAHRDDLKRFGAKPDKTQLIYMGVDGRFHPPVPRPSRVSSIALKLIYVGSVAPDRGRDVMLEAMAQIAHDPASRHRVHLTILGANAEQLSHCEARLRQLDASDHVTVLGRVPGHEVPRYLKDADLGLCLWEDLPWYRFNPPTKLFEYLVAGLPVMASRIRTHTAYVQDGQNGFIFDYNPEGLVHGIQAALSPDINWRELNQRTWESGKPYLWDAIEPKFLEVVQTGVRT
jgi:glycosyltransferase involved in cell wall biosynthesis